MRGKLLTVVLLLVLSACRTPPDRKIEKEALLKAPEAVEKSPPYSKPFKQPATTYPDGAEEIISLTVTDHMPVRHVLTELARQAHVGLNLPVDLPDKRVMLTLHNRPIHEAVDQLCAMSGFRASWQGNTLQIELDAPYNHNYSVQFLNLTRSSDHHVATSTDVFANNSKGPQLGDNGSDSEVKNKGENDFWQELEKNLSLILGKDGSYTMHRQAGLITVIGKKSQHQQVESYLDRLRKAVRSQVVIEAKIIEVILKDEFKSGVNWKKIKGTDIKLDMPLGDKAGTLGDSTSTSSMLQFGVAGKAFESIVQALDEFGIARTLSSPRITVMNNQTALLKVAKNQVYFRLRYDKRYNTQNATQESIAVSSDIQTVPIGLVLSVHPSIDLDSGEVILFLRPTISRLNDSVSDPAVDIAAQSNSNIQPSKVPVVEVREIDSVLRTKSGDIAVLGGLMEVRTTEELSQVPILGQAPLLDQILGAHGNSTHVVELVILLRATISDAAPDAADERVSRQMEDPRPFHG